MLAQELCKSLRENIAPRGPAHALFAGKSTAFCFHFHGFLSC